MKERINDFHTNFDIQLSHWLNMMLIDNETLIALLYASALILLN